MDGGTSSVGLFKLGVDALKTIPLSDIHRARLELAMEQGEAFSLKVDQLQAQVGELRAELKISKVNEAEAKADLNALRQEHEEEVRVAKGIEFRRGKRTGNQWLPFCPKCHLPCMGDHWEQNSILCSDGECDWSSGFTYAILKEILPTLH